MEYVEVVPKSYPTNLLNKDWSKRKWQETKQDAAFIAKLHEMRVKEDDVWINTLAKSGTTWMQELVWLVMHDFDFKGAKSEYLELRSPFLESEFYMKGDLDRCFEPVEKLESPRLIKTHMPLPLLPAQLWQKKPKLIYVYRHPIDALVSLFSHVRRGGKDLDKTLEEFLRDYIEEDSLKEFPFEHVAEFYALRNEPWVYYTSYERMKSNLSEVIQDVCQFLNKTINEEQMEEMLKHLSFEEMKNNPMTHHYSEFDEMRIKFNASHYEDNHFIRKGKVNAYKEELSEAFRTMMEKWVANNLAQHNLTLKELLLLEDN